MKKTFSSAALLSLFFLHSYLAQAEWMQPSFPNCAFYLQAESELGCAKKGAPYLKDYGFYYCNKFRERMKNWSPELQRWTHNTGQCLQEMLFDNRAKRLTSCHQMEEFAFDSHPICYKQYEFCKLSFRDMNEVRSVLEITHIANSVRRSWSQVENVLLACAQYKFFGSEITVIEDLSRGAQTGAKEQELALQIVELAPAEQHARQKFFDRALRLLANPESAKPQLASEGSLSKSGAFYDTPSEQRLLKALSALKSN